MSSFIHSIPVAAGPPGPSMPDPGGAGTRTPAPDDPAVETPTAIEPVGDLEVRARLRCDRPGAVADLLDLGFALAPARALVSTRRFDHRPPGGRHLLFRWSGDPERPVVEDLGSSPLSEAGLGRRLAATGIAALATGRVHHTDNAAFDGGAPVRVLQQVDAGEDRSPAVSAGRLPVLTAVGRAEQIVVVDDSEGRQADVLLRMLGRPTSPPRGAPVWFWLVAWLVDAVVAGAGRDLRRVVAWHPAIDPAELSWVGGDELVDFVVQRHRDHAAATGWGGLRRTAMADALEFGGIDPTLAAWLDDGSFARLLDERLGSPAALAMLLRRSFPAPVLAAVTEIVVRVGSGDPPASRHVLPGGLPR